MSTIRDALDTLDRYLERELRGATLVRWRGGGDVVVIIWRREPKVEGREYGVHGWNIYNGTLYSGSYDLTLDEAVAEMDRRLGRDLV